ncbi:hypothetical protein [Listeria ivanovii]|uniref:Secreted protein n=2 Tax=Listeria ivanovii TaxID=1638 RepID=A0ABS1G4G3_LISIV|nr:hypothetical protein [Listeria ivanovii]EFR97760.1 putative secreted protein [Listeria ivanovii FSL F6-596]AIS59160.1 hypothetical protein JL58_03810 [Listeria ivanovii subsp. londoniensis]MBC2254821.1 hypothetical protein [Listeria ivanovii]MBK1961630.1 hypothetical protein [Listeria ivanovii subsp. londoniensis]MBK2002381.1 hypothetical protein [Listeria ivanovii subsp. londoniensis]
MKKSVKISLIIVGIAVVIFAGVMLSYRFLKSMDVIANEEINESATGNHVLLATQGSDFKDSVIDQIKQDMAKENVHISIMDTTKLDKVNADDYDKIVLFTTVQSDDIPENVTTFMNDNKDKGIHIAVTADSGRWDKQPKDVDAISEASKSENKQDFVDDLSQAILK